jgi:hypothetical protein
MFKVFIEPTYNMIEASNTPVSASISGKSMKFTGEANHLGVNTKFL